MENLRKRSFGFLVHWIETWNWLLWFSRDLHRHPEHARRWIWLYPVYFAASVFYLLAKKACDEVDRFTFDNGKIEGRTWVLRNFGWHFFLGKYKRKIKTRILEAVLALQEEVQVIGLGALVKAEWLTEGGKWIVDKLGDQLKVPVVHGDTLTAATVIKQVLRAIGEYKITTPVFITGATSKIGRAVALALASQKIQVAMYTESRKRFSAIMEEAGEFGRYVQMAPTLAGGSVCQLWVTGKAIPAGQKLLKAIPKNAVVINFSVPNPVPEKLFRKRSDLIFVEGGLLSYNSERTDLSFTMRLRPGITYACHAGTMVHAYMGWKHHEVGQVELSQLPVVWDAATTIGFFLPPLKSESKEKASESFFQKTLRQMEKVMSIFF